MVHCVRGTGQVVIDHWPLIIVVNQKNLTPRKIGCKLFEELFLGDFFKQIMIGWLFWFRVWNLVMVECYDFCWNFGLWAVFMFFFLDFLAGCAWGLGGWAVGKAYPNYILHPDVVLATCTCGGGEFFTSEIYVASRFICPSCCWVPTAVGNVGLIWGRDNPPGNQHMTGWKITIFFWFDTSYHMKLSRSTGRGRCLADLGRESIFAGGSSSCSCWCLQ